MTLFFVDAKEGKHLYHQRERMRQGELQSDDNLYENKLLDDCHGYKANVKPEEVLRKAQHLK